MCSRAWVPSSSSVAVELTLNCTTAATLWPQRSSATPTTVQSKTAGCALSACSTSSGKTFSPPVLMLTDPRPSIVIMPFPAHCAESPDTA